MKRLAPCATALIALTGCGGSAINTHQLAQSVADAGRRLLVQSDHEMTNNGVPPSDLTSRIENPSCLNANSGDRSPTGTTAEFACFFDETHPGASRNEKTFWQVNVYSTKGSCWKGVVSTVEYGVGTPEFYEGRISKAEMDRGEYDFHGCIGQAPSATQTRTATQTVTQTTPQPPPQIKAQSQSSGAGSTAGISTSWTDCGGVSPSVHPPVGISDIQASGIRCSMAVPISKGGMRGWHQCHGSRPHPPSSDPTIPGYGIFCKGRARIATGGQ